jgi:integrase
LVDLRWEQVDLQNAILHVRRVKQGHSGHASPDRRELRALRRLQREHAPKSPFVFVSERGTPLSIRGFQAMVERRSKAGAGRQPVLLRCYERSLVRRALDHRKDADPEHTDRNKIIRRETIDNGRNIPEWFIEQFMKAVEWLAKLVRN